MIFYYQNLYLSLQSLKQKTQQLSLSMQETVSLQAAIDKLQQLIQIQLWEIMHEDKN